MNRSSEEDKFPSCFKISNFLTVFKSAKRDKVVSYRPSSISHMLPKSSKSSCIIDLLHLWAAITYYLIPKLVSDLYLENSYAITEFQDVAHHCLGNKEVSAAVFLDFSKTFHGVSHYLLMNELYIYGFGSILLSWSRSYLKKTTLFKLLWSGYWSSSGICLGSLAFSNLW